MTRSIGGIENLVVVDGVVERQAEANGMRRLQLRPRHVKCLLVRLLRLVRGAFLGVGREDLGKGNSGRKGRQQRGVLKRGQR